MEHLGDVELEATARAVVAHELAARPEGAARLLPAPAQERSETLGGQRAPGQVRRRHPGQERAELTGDLLDARAVADAAGAQVAQLLRQRQADAVRIAGLERAPQELELQRGAQDGID